MSFIKKIEKDYNEDLISLKELDDMRNKYSDLNDNDKAILDKQNQTVSEPEPRQQKSSNVELNHNATSSNKNSVNKANETVVRLSPAKILSINSSGIGERVCIDLIERLEIGEGMVIGSTSSSLALVHGETIESEYVPSRPFRVNAGSIHSYVLMADKSTKYLSELSAGDEVAIISYSGKIRKSIICRLKIEKRPFLILRFKSKSGEDGQIILQQAETVRLVDTSGGVISVTDLEIDDEIIVRIENQMRHIGKSLDGEMNEK